MRGAKRTRLGEDMMTASAIVDESYVYVIRREHQNEWLTRAKAGGKQARLCVLAASKFMKAMPNRPCGCACCVTRFPRGAVPQAFIILIPIKQGPETVWAHSRAVCSQCSTHDDQWLIDQGAFLKALAPDHPGHKQAAKTRYLAGGGRKRPLLSHHCM
jgi:hypothetical protein